MAPRINVIKTRNHDYRATFDGFASGPSRTGATASAARTKFQEEVTWRNGKPYDTHVNGMTAALSTMKKVRRFAIKRPLNFAGRIALTGIAASLIGFIALHHLIINEAAPVKQDNKVFMRTK